MQPGASGPLNIPDKRIPGFSSLVSHINRNCGSPLRGPFAPFDIGYNCDPLRSQPGVPNPSNLPEQALLAPPELTNL